MLWILTVDDLDDDSDLQASLTQELGDAIGDVLDGTLPLLVGTAALARRWRR